MINKMKTYIHQNNEHKYPETIYYPNNLQTTNKPYQIHHQILAHSANRSRQIQFNNHYQVQKRRKVPYFRR